jgi:hypothetical protein
MVNCPFLRASLLFMILSTEGTSQRHSTLSSQWACREMKWGQLRQQEHMSTLKPAQQGVLLACFSNEMKLFVAQTKETDIDGSLVPSVCVINRNKHKQ